MRHEKNPAIRSTPQLRPRRRDPDVLGLVSGGAMMHHPNGRDTYERLWSRAELEDAEAAKRLGEWAPAIATAGDVAGAPGSIVKSGAARSRAPSPLAKSGGAVPA